MCVTNTTHRRSQAISLNPATNVVGGMISQRLLGGGVFPSGLPLNNFAHQPVNEYVPTVPQQKQRPKRRRKPQKPGKTAKMNDRHFVQHDYHDHLNDRDEEIETEEEHHRRRGGVAVAFPMKLHAVLDQVEADGLSHVVSWQPHGRCFVIHDPKEFVEHVMPK